MADRDEPSMAQDSSATLLHKPAVPSEERAAIRVIWNDFMDRTRRCTISRANLVQGVVSVVFLIITMIGTCHLGRAPVCLLDPWLTDSLPLAAFQLAVNLVYLFWPDVPEKLVRTKLPILVQLAAAFGWAINLVAAGVLVYEGFTLGTPYHVIHIPRFILSVAEIVCTKIILVVTVRQYLLARGRSSTLPR